MKSELFGSMARQMRPSPEVRVALDEKLAQRAKRRPPRGRYAALAACAALVLCAYPVYRAVQPKEGALHSYVMVDAATPYRTEQTELGASTGGGGEDALGADCFPGGDAPDGGDRDMDMTADELTQAMLEAGYTQEEVDEYQSIGYQMTWAKWWKFVNERRSSESDAPFDLDSLCAFSQQELYVSTGALLGGAYVGDGPAQEEAGAAYQKLMDRFGGDYPAWYGGAYIDDAGYLTVLLVESEDPADKSLELQVLEWTGSDRVLFAGAKYSLAHLNGLMAQLDQLPGSDPKCGDVMAGWGVNEVENRIELTLTQVNDHILSVLAELDPADDAICVQVGQRATLTEDIEEPVSHAVTPGGATAPEGREPVAYEPYGGDMDGAHYGTEGEIQDLPAQKQPAVQPGPEADIAVDGP